MKCYSKVNINAPNDMLRRYKIKYQNTPEYILGRKFRNVPDN